MQQIENNETIIKTYVNYLKAESYCVDFSGQRPSLLHSRGNREASPQLITLGFAKWARTNNVMVATKEYRQFLETLESKVMAKLPHVLGRSFMPIDAPIFTDHAGCQLANTYVPYKPDYQPAPQILIEYWERIFQNEEDRKHVQSFLADIIQNPTRRPQHALMITGDQGNGKSLLHRLVKMALGDNHVYDTNTYTAAFAKFSEIFPNNLLVAFDDAKASKDTHGNLKLSITCPTQEVEIKGQQQFVRRDVKARVMVISNLRRPMQMDNCRRFYATEFSTHCNNHNPQGKKENTDEFFTRFLAWLDTSEASRALYHFFMDVDLENFNPGSIPQTDTLLEMIDMGRSSLTRLIETYIDEKPIFHVSQLFLHLEENNIKNPPLDLIKTCLQERSYKLARRIIKGCGNKQVDVWCPITGKVKTREITEDEAESIAAMLARSF